MLAGVRDPDAAIGAMPPLFGPVTARAAAWCAVAAGCRAPEFAVLLTAAAAMLEPQFNLLGLATTTGSAAVAMIVHGPLAARLGMNASVNCLGPGNRANAAIGRAVALVLVVRNIGGARSGSGDMVTLGQPGKNAFCFAEADEAPLPLLHVRRGLAAGESAVTLLGVSGTAEILPIEERDTTAAILDRLARAIATAHLVGGAYRQPALAEHPFILPPELAGRLAARGFGLAQIQAYLAEAAQHDGRPVAATPQDIHPIIAGGPGVKMAHLPLWGGGTRMVTRRLTGL
jgi:hypothetical protein